MMRDGIKAARFFAREVLVNRKNRKRLINRSPTIFSSDCTGGVLLHDLRIKFNSPTINMFFMAESYLKFIKNPQYYLDLPMRDTYDPNYDYPVAAIADIKLHLVHYDSVKEAQAAWDKRKLRIDFGNAYYIMNDRNECTLDYMQEFDSLPYKNKVIFVHRKDWADRFESAFYIRGYEKEDYVGIMTAFTRKASVYRNFDQFDYVSWLNQK